MIAYLDLPSGLSGDMMLGCLIDAGWSAERLRETIESLSLPASQWAVQIRDVQKGSLRATQVEVLAEDGVARRGLADIISIIDGSSLAKKVRDRAAAVFRRLADAEARVHGTTPDQIHFHEVGAVDAIIDIVGSIAGLHELGVDRLHASAIPLASGWTDSAHGKLPLPAPATLELLAAAKAPIRPAPGMGELITPTGAALLAELAIFSQPAMTLRRVGIGAGQRDFAWPNVARLWLGEAEGDGPIVQLETNIDDMNPQLYAAVSDKLFAAGARDVWLTPVQMKKGRPGMVMSVLGAAGDESSLADLLLRETTTLGVRVHSAIHRHEASREIRRISTPFGDVAAKIKWLGRDPAGVTPEYDDCVALAESAVVPLRAVHESATAAAHALLMELKEEVSRGPAPPRIT
ncbi:MAG TPA: nickel pincer cofactor biosynthesis protein LarC [Tepidisphaeraceae bacterium]|nr:nickel pincer cofactor biosynthesis protein LarC [Tepidisphaeraceae bacterium]